jgi:hypothetical protein
LPEGATLSQNAVLPVRSWMKCTNKVIVLINLK